MAQRKLLLDSNTYFRLAREIHPLLFQIFGSEQYCLYVLDDLQKEYDNSPRLRQRFDWVDEESFRNNRSKRLQLGRKDKAAIQKIYRFMWDTVQTDHPGPSRIDVNILAHAYALGITVVTDDADMIGLAKIYEVKVISTLQLMKLMLDCGHIDMEDVERVVLYWKEITDFPGGFHGDYKRLFKKKPP